MIRWLGDAISTESQKPFDEIDHDFVDECGLLLDELMGDSAAVSDEEIAAKASKIIPVTSAVRKKIRCRNLWKIAVAAAVVLCLSVSTLAETEHYHPVKRAMQLESGETFEENGFVYSAPKKAWRYTDIDTLIAEEKLDILSFEDPEGKLEITEIMHVPGENTSFYLNDTSVHYTIKYDRNAFGDDLTKNSEVYETPYATVYLITMTDVNPVCYAAYFMYSDDTYTITSSDEEALFAVLNSLK